MVCKGVLPPVTYGGTERVVWGLVKALHQLGHNVFILNPNKVECGDFAKSIRQNLNIPIDEQIPPGIDIVHFHTGGQTKTKPFVVTQHGNNLVSENTKPNTIFVSERHAINHGCNSYVYNGLDWSDYNEPNLKGIRKGGRYHFLGKAAWKVKNVKGAIAITKKSQTKLDVLGGTRINFKMGFRFTFNRHVKFHGMVNNAKKCNILQNSNGLIFPITWEEPFGLAVIESLFMGTPVFATPYGSLPELVSNPDLGILSNVEDELADAIKYNSYLPYRCHEYAREYFDHLSMAKEYIKYYERAISGQRLNSVSTQKNNRLKNLPYHKN